MHLFCSFGQSETIWYSTVWYRLYSAVSDKSFKFINTPPNGVFEQYGLFEKEIECWFKNQRPLLKSKFDQMPPSKTKDQIGLYIEHHLRKIRKECGNTPSRKLINTPDQGKLARLNLTLPNLTRLCHVISVRFDSSQIT